MNFSSKVEELEFSIRVHKRLHNAGIIYIGDLVQKSEAELLRLNGFGRLCLKEVREELASWGLRLAMGPPQNWVSDQGEEMQRMEQALQRVLQWAEAYPIEIFREPDWARAAEVLDAAGLSLDAISASCIRRVLNEIAATARQGLRR